MKAKVLFTTIDSNGDILCGGKFVTVLEVAETSVGRANMHAAILLDCGIDYVGV